MMHGYYKFMVPQCIVFIEMAASQRKGPSCACIFQNPRTVPISKLEYPIPKAGDYWRKFCDDEEKKVIKVRHSIPNLPDSPFTRYSSFIKNTFYPDPVPRALSREQLKSILKRNASIEPTLPQKLILKISPPTPLKRTPEHFVISENVEIISDGEGTSVENNLFSKNNLIRKLDSKSTFSAPTRNAANKKVYPKGSCPLHRNEPPVKIFDDEIDQYLVQVEKTPFASPDDAQTSQAEETKSKSKRQRTKKRRSKSCDPRNHMKQNDTKDQPLVIDETDNSKDAPIRVLLPTSDTTNQILTTKSSRQKRIPKLKSASLLPSFARTVSESSSESFNTPGIEHQSDIIKNNDMVQSLPLDIFPPNLLELPDTEQSSKTEVDNESSTSQDLLKVPGVPSHRQKHDLVKTRETESKANGGTKAPKPEVTKESELTAIVTDTKIHEDGSRVDFEEPVAEDATLSSKDGKVNEEKRSSKNRHSLRYSVRCAYRALKFITANKKLDFEPKYEEKPSEKSLSGSSDDSQPEGKLESFDIKENEAGDHSDDEDALFHRDVQKRLRKKWKRSMKPTSAEYGDSSTATAKSIIIPTRSRSTSGMSNKFTFRETSRCRAANILDRLPAMSYPRKTHDRCLSCLYRSLEPRNEQKLDTNRERTISSHRDEDEKSQKEAIASGGSADSRSSSITLPDFAARFEENFRADVELGDYQKTIDELSAGISSRSQIKEERAVGDAGEPIKKEAASNADATTQRSVDLSLLPKDSSRATRTATKSTSVSSEKSMHSSSPGAQSTDETESPVILAGEDSADSKYLAPCHAPTILKPSLEHLRALRFKKTATVKQARTDEVGRLTTDTSADEDVENRATRSADDRRGGKGSEAPSSRETKDEPRKILTKMKSVMEKMSDATLSVRDVTLRRGSSCLDLTMTAAAAEPKSITEETPASMDVLVEDVLKKYLFHGNALRLVSDLPRFSIENFVEFAKEYLAQNLDAIEALEKLCDEFLKRVLESLGSARDLADAKRDDLVRQLVKLLVDSKRYLNPNKYPSDLLFSSEQPPLFNSRQLRRILPLNIYNMVAPILGMPEWHSKLSTPSLDRLASMSTKRIRPSDKDNESDEASGDDLVVHPPTTKDESSAADEKRTRQRLNLYALFLKKPRRKVITWRPLTEKDLEGYDPNATLSMRAKNVTDKICKEFCEWLRSLGDTDEVIDEEVLRDMFQIDFSAEAVRAMQVSFKEMPTVPDDVAFARRCPGATVLAMTKKEVIKDAQAESKPKRTVAFGTSLPRNLQFIPPKNRVRETWLECQYVPRDLETMEAVWKGITHLESVKGFVKSLHEKNIQLPEALKSVKLSDAMKPSEDDTFAHMELEIGQIRSLKVEDT